MNLAGAARYARWKARRAAKPDQEVTAERLEGPGLLGLPETPLWPLLQPFYSVGVWASALSVMIGSSTAALVMTPVIPYAKSHNWCGGAGMARCLKLTGSELHVTYDPGFDPERRSVFCQNHISVLDAHVACSIIPHSFCGLMIHWHFNIPGYGMIMRLANGIPVYPKASGRTAEITAAAKDRIAKGISILVFPEGHRTRDGNVRDFRRGVFFMARDAGVPVVPLAVRGLRDVNARGEWNFTPGKVEVYVGPQQETVGLSDKDVAALAARMTAFADRWVKDGVADLDVLQGQGD